VAGRDAAWKNCAFAERTSSMLRTPQYKLIRNTGKGVRNAEPVYELYDLLNDPQETRNLANDAAHAATVQELAGRLEAWQKTAPAVPTLPGVERLPREGSRASESVQKPKRRRDRRKAP
jgi:arylsulfatase A-like enzyme